MYTLLEYSLKQLFLHELKQVLTNFISLFNIIGTIVFHKKNHILKFCIHCWNNLFFNIKENTVSSTFLHELKQVLTNFISLFHIIETIVFHKKNHILKFCIHCWNNLFFNIKENTVSSTFLHELKQVLTNFISLFHIIGTINIARSIETQSQLLQYSVLYFE